MNLKKIAIVSLVSLVSMSPIAGFTMTPAKASKTSVEVNLIQPLAAGKYSLTSKTLPISSSQSNTTETGFVNVTDQANGQTWMANIASTQTSSSEKIQKVKYSYEVRIFKDALNTVRYFKVSDRGGYMFGVVNAGKNNQFEATGQGLIYFLKKEGKLDVQIQSIPTGYEVTYSVQNENTKEWQVFRTTSLNRLKN